MERFIRQKSSGVWPGIYAAQIGLPHSGIILRRTFGRAEKVMTEKDLKYAKLKERYDAVKKATAAQIEVFVSLGDDVITGKPSAEISREQLGNAAVNYDVHLRQTTELYGIPISGIAMGILNNAGLLFRGI